MVNNINIYCLKDPKTLEVRYVGKTKLSLEKRLNQHIKESKTVLNKNGQRNINKRYSWIISLLKNNIVPIIELIEETDELNWCEREKFWISKYENLTNMTSGGEGGDTNSGKTFRKKTDYEKKIISEKTKIAMNNENIKEKARKGAYITLSKILDENGKLRKDIVEKIRKNSKKKVNVFIMGLFVEKMESIEDFIKKYKTSYSSFNRKTKIFFKKEYFIDLNKLDLKKLLLNNNLIQY
jgi:hypothetical protein